MEVQLVRDDKLVVLPFRRHIDQTGDHAMTHCEDPVGADDGDQVGEVGQARLCEQAAPPPARYASRPVRSMRLRRARAAARHRGVAGCPGR